jgi:hypothetical protein
MMSILVLLLPILTGAASSRSYVSGNHTLTLDGVQTGFVKSVQGGKVYAEVINEPMGSDKVVRKHIGQPKYEDYVMTKLKNGRKKKMGNVVEESEVLKQVDDFQRLLLYELLRQCTLPQQELFERMYKSVEEVPPENLRTALVQVERTVKKNKLILIRE